MIDFYIGLSSGIKASLIITFVLMVVTTMIGLRVKKLETSDVPQGITLLSMDLVKKVNGMVKDLYGKKWRPYAPFLLTILLFLLFANTIALFGLNAPLSNISVALSFSIFAFATIQIVALFVQKPLKRAKDLASPNILLTPINLVGEISTPLAMGLRLFGNLLSGSIIGLIIFRGSYELSLFIFSLFDFNILSNIAFVVVQTIGVGIGSFIHAIFDIFFGAIQAYVYFMLFSIFMKMAVED